MRNAPWSPFHPPGAFASGLPRIQLVRLPPFSPPTFWQVCELGSEWLLYSATVVDPDPYALAMQGYERVEFEGGKLKAYFERLTSQTLPIAPDLSNRAGLDGTVTQLALFGGLSSQVRFQWWSEYPPGWARLVEIADEMFAAFGGPGAGE